MKQLLTVVAFFLLLASCSKAGEEKSFKKTEYVNGVFYRQAISKLKSSSINLHFFKQNFFTPYHLPEKLIDKDKKGQTISVWSNPNGEKDYKQNWENIYTYDNNGRITNYGYSGCFICSQFPYNYTFIYNSNGNIERIFNTLSSKDNYKLFYNTQGDLTKIEGYQNNMLETVIELVD